MVLFMLPVGVMFFIFLRLRIAFKWMVRAFSGYLSTDQLLLLWDRILGYDSLEVVAGGQMLNSHTNYAVRHYYITDTFSVSKCFTFLFLFDCPAPVLAAAVFAFRAENLMEVTSLASAEVCCFFCLFVCFFGWGGGCRCAYLFIYNFIPAVSLSHTAH